MPTHLSSVMAGNRTFDVVNIPPWHTLYWADGPAMLALGLSDGDTITSIPDEMGTSGDNLVPVKGGSTGATWVASGAAHGKPAWSFDATTSDYFRLSGNASAWTKGAILSGGVNHYTIICATVGDLPSQADTSGLYSSPDNGAGANGYNGVSARARRSNAIWTPSNGAQRFSGVTGVYSNNTTYALQHSISLIGSSTFSTNGTIIDTQTATAYEMSALRLAGKQDFPTYSWEGDISFWGVIAGDITTYSWFNAFNYWFKDYFGEFVD